MGIKVLEVLNAFPGETFLMEHAKALRHNSSDIELLWSYTQTSRYGSIKPSFQNGPSCYAIPNFDRLSKYQKLRLVLRHRTLKRDKLRVESALRIVRRINPDVIHFQFASTAFNWAWLAIKLKIPFSFSLRGSDINVYPITIDGYTEELKEVSKTAVRIHAVTNAIKERFIDLTGVESRKIEVIRTCISEVWKNIQRKPVDGNVIFIGRLHWIKGLFDLLLACNILKEKKVEFKLTIIGEGPERPHLEYMIRDLNLTENVFLLGRKTPSEIRAYIKDAEIAVQTSLHEGFPNSLAEAMYAKLPIVTVDCGGITEVLQNGYNAYVTEVGNPERIAETLRLALENKEKSKALAKRAFRDAESYFSYQKHGKSFSSFFRKVCCND